MEACHSVQVLIAKKSVECFVKSSIRPDVSEVPALREEENGPAGAFVSIKKKGALRGCIGTLEPTRSSLSEEIIYNAIKAAVKDPRFPSLNTNELEDIDITVDVLSPSKPVHSISELDPMKYGLIVSATGRRGLLLPALEGVETTEQQISICRSKGGIGPGEDIVLHRFEVKRYR